MLELVAEKGNTRAQTWIDAEKHFYFSILSGSSHKRKLDKGREISADEEVLQNNSPFVEQLSICPELVAATLEQERVCHHNYKSCVTEGTGALPCCDILVASDGQKVGTFLFHWEHPHHTGSDVLPCWNTRVL